MIKITSGNLVTIEYWYTGSVMSSFEFNKIIGAILSVALVSMIISFIGNALVQPSNESPADIKIAEAATPAQKKEFKVESIVSLMPMANVEKGKAQSAKCKGCHDLNASKKNKIGPPLWNILLAKRGVYDGFSYSKAMANMGGKWDYEALNGFLAKPKRYLKGTKMAFAGIKKAKDRADLIAFLRTLSDAPKPLP